MKKKKKRWSFEQLTIYNISKLYSLHHQVGVSKRIIRSNPKQRISEFWSNLAIRIQSVISRISDKKYPFESDIRDRIFWISNLSVLAFFFKLYNYNLIIRKLMNKKDITIQIIRILLDRIGRIGKLDWIFLLTLPPADQ